MDLQEAIQTGKDFKRPEWKEFVKNPYGTKEFDNAKIGLLFPDLLAKDYLVDFPKFEGYVAIDNKSGDPLSATKDEKQASQPGATFSWVKVVEIP